MYSQAANIKSGKSETLISEGNLVTVHVSPPDQRKGVDLKSNKGKEKDNKRQGGKLSPIMSLRNSIVSSMRNSFVNSDTKPFGLLPVRKRKKSHSDSAHQATTTIYIVTGLYVIFNVPVWIFVVAVLFSATDHLPWFRCHLMYLHIFLNRICVVMNAASNGVVYFARMKDLRRTCFEELKKLLRFDFCKNQ